MDSTLKPRESSVAFLLWKQGQALDLRIKARKVATVFAQNTLEDRNELSIDRDGG